MWKSLVLGAAALLTAASANAATATWSAGNGHSYEVVLFGNGPGLTWEQSRDAAAARSIGGQTGYLATFTTKDEWAFVTGALNSAKHDLFLGATDTDAEGIWKWVVGPEAGTLLSDGYTAWNRGEPHDHGRGGEDYLAGWSYGRNTGWNDMPGRHTAIKGYLVEYGSVAPVPLPAALPLALAAIGALAGLRRLRRG